MRRDGFDVMATVAAEVGRVRALARRDLQIEHSYRMRYFVRLAEAFVSITILYYVSRFLVDAPALEPYGSYFDFAIVGIAVMSVAQLGISTFNQNILREQNLGTFEVLLVTPTPISVLLAGSFVFPLVLTGLDLILYLGLGLGFVGGGLTPTGILLAIPLLVLTLASFCAFGVAGAGLVVLIKRGDPLTAPLTMVTTVLSGALFPVSEYPRGIEVLAHAFPAFYGITGLREALLQSGGVADVAPDLLILLAFDIVLLPLAVYLFKRCLAAARTTGVLGNY
jgi:ABC-2 type transport system permease protein